MADLKKLQQEFKSYLQQKNPNYAPSTLNTYCADAFFALNNDIGLDFVDILTTDEGIHKYELALSNYFDNLTQNRGKDFPQRHVQNYLDRIIQFKQFLGLGSPSI